MWRVKAERLKELENAFKKQGVFGASNIATETRIPLASLQRIMRGEWFRNSTNLRRLFATLVVAGCGEQMTVDILIDEYCESKTVRNEDEQKPADVFEPSLSCLLMYFKFLHLRDKRVSAPVYQKYIPRLNRLINVFDEFVLIKTLFFKETQKNQEFYGRSMGVVDIQPIFPPRDHVIVSDPGLMGIEGVIRHIESEPSQLYQTIAFYENGLQSENEEIGGVVPDDCARAVIMVDMTSLPDWSNGLLLSHPVCYHLRPEANGTTQKRMNCQQTSTGLWMIDTARVGDETDEAVHWEPDKDRLRKNDKIEMRLAINWDKINRRDSFPD
jgi:hypothetical protein